MRQWLRENWVALALSLFFIFLGAYIMMNMEGLSKRYALGFAVWIAGFLGFMGCLIDLKRSGIMAKAKKVVKKGKAATATPKPKAKKKVTKK